MREVGQVVVDVRMGLFEFSEKIARPEEMWVPIRDKTPGVFDDTPEMRRVDDTPENGDTWVMKLSSTGVFSLEVARYRTDLYMAGRGRQSVEDVRASFVEHAVSIAEMFVGQHAGRIGLVARVFYQDDTPHAMAAKVLRTVPADDKVASVLVRYVLHTRFAELEMNDSTSIDSNTVAMVVGAGSGLKGVQVTRDLNIAKGMLWASTQENVTSFLNWAFDTLGLDTIEGALWATTK